LPPLRAACEVVDLNERKGRFAGDEDELATLFQVNIRRRWTKFMLAAWAMPLSVLPEQGQTTMPPSERAAGRGSHKIVVPMVDQLSIHQPPNWRFFALEKRMLHRLEKRGWIESL